MQTTDGGVTKGKAGRVVSPGVELISTGSAVHDGVAPAENARAMLEAVRQARGAHQLAGVTKEGQ